MTSPLKISVAKTVDGAKATIVGDLRDDVSAVLNRTASELAGVTGKVTFDCHGLSFINSQAIAFWSKFMRGLKMKLVFEGCSSYLIEYLNVFPELLGKGTVASFFGPYTCKTCNKSAEIPFTVAKIDHEAGIPATVPCPSCSGKMACDVDPVEYLAFLGD
jgi:hypothetical protein